MTDCIQRLNDRINLYTLIFTGRTVRGRRSNMYSLIFNESEAYYLIGLHAYNDSWYRLQTIPHSYSFQFIAV